MTKDKKNRVGRRDFLKILGGGVAATSAASLVGCKPKSEEREDEASDKIYNEKVDFRVNPNKTGDKVSLLGYGMARLPFREDMKQANGSAKREKGVSPIDQEMVNKLVDHAIEHGINYFDTSPAYGQGFSESSTGIALARHDRDKFFVATKLSNYSPVSWPIEASKKMYYNSLKALQVDYIDYMLLHFVGKDGMTDVNNRFLDNGALEFLMEERKAGRVRNLGFSYHGDIEPFDYFLSKHDYYQWDFVLIQVNYLTWDYADVLNSKHTDAKYLVEELNKRHIPILVMEPLLGGRLAKLPSNLADKLYERRPNDSLASWAFRYAASVPEVLCVLSGMTYMEHLEENIKTFSPLEQLNEEEVDMLHGIAKSMMEYPLVSCTGCQYCMPCPYGIDIPEILKHYNNCVSEEHFPEDSQDENYKASRRAFLVGYDRKVPKLRQASSCIGCGECLHHCPQGVNIPKELTRIDRYVESLKQGEYSMAAIRQTLEESQSSRVIAKASKIKEYKNQAEIADLYNLIHSDDAQFIEGSKVADRVVGKGAAALMIAAGVKEIYAQSISDSAIKLLNQHNVKLSYSESRPCESAIEERCQDSDDIDVIISCIEQGVLL